MDLALKPSSDHRRLLQKLEARAILSEADAQALCALPLVVKEVGANLEVVREGDEPTYCCLVIEGLLERYRVLPDGCRQIVALHLPGDVPDLQSLHLTRIDHALGTVSASRIGLIARSAVQSLVQNHPSVAAALWRETLVDAAILREWVVNIGARSAYARIAHLFCELHMRLTAVDLAERDGFTLSLTQLRIGEATGLSTVHVNRTVQELRRAGLIEVRGPYLQILDEPGLRRACGFDPAYLHLDPAPLC